jgi:hypothetical protein
MEGEEVAIEVCGTTFEYKKETAHQLNITDKLITKL